MTDTIPSINTDERSWTLSSVGSRESHRPLPTDFLPHMQSVLDAYKKNCQVAKQNGEVSEQANGPNSWGMFP